MLSLFSRLLQVRGVVLPIVNACLHLAAELADGFNWQRVPQNDIILPEGLF